MSGFFQWLRSSTCPYQEAAARSPQRPDTDSGRTSDTIRTREPPAHPGHYSPAFNLVSATCTVCAFFRLFVSYDVIISCVSHWRAGTDLPQADSVIVFLVSYRMTSMVFKHSIYIQLYAACPFHSGSRV